MWIMFSVFLCTGKFVVITFEVKFLMPVKKIIAAIFENQ